MKLWKSETLLVFEYNVEKIMDGNKLWKSLEINNAERSEERILCFLFFSRFFSFALFWILITEREFVSEFLRISTKLAKQNCLRFMQFGWVPQ